MPFVLWTRVGPRKQVLVRCTLAPPVECQCTIHVRQQCGLLSNYFEHCTRPTYAQRLWTACQWIVAPTTLTGFAVKPLAITRHACVVECRHVKARFPNSITLAGSELVRSWFEAKFHYVIWIEPASNQLRTTFEPPPNQTA